MVPVRLSDSAIARHVGEGLCSLAEAGERKTEQNCLLTVTRYPLVKFPGTIGAMASAIRALLQPCAERLRLAKRFADAARDYSNAIAQLAEHRGTTSELEYYKLRILVDESRQNSKAAGLAFEQHISRHEC